MPHLISKIAVMAPLLGSLFVSPVTAEINVVTTIKPLHSIVNNIMLGVGKPVLLILSAVSPHDYKLKPSDIRTLQQANVIFWVGPQLESRLAKLIQQRSQTAKVVTLLSSKELRILKITGRKTIDPHIWLSPENARTIAAIVQRTLSTEDPKNTAIYLKNFKKLDKTLIQLRREISAGLSIVLKAPFIVYHDGLLYFENEFGLNNQGAILVSPEHHPGAKRLSYIRRLIKKQKIRCVFGEPHYSQKLLKTVTAHSPAKIGTLDLIGVKLAPGPNLYASLMRNLAASFKSCLQD